MQLELQCAGIWHYICTQSFLHVLKSVDFLGAYDCPGTGRARVKTGWPGGCGDAPQILVAHCEEVEGIRFRIMFPSLMFILKFKLLISAKCPF